ncbi:GGDEF domain-containing protein [Shewanella carassii]|uniref:diguanylate cyclase n=1 Tax=Shewanella carassii TaxID=1987584 RepID=A0ABQ1T191_9GAMM|nr:sensor domain-containing diguanylate cyclase [Shewanella carassii]GGE73024.1 GGDEF domain-containing protein [Shewanella carassii]
MFSLSQTLSIFAALPDPVFILTRSGRYAAVLGGADSRYYHNGTTLVGKYVSQVLQQPKSEWFLSQIAQALLSRRLWVVEYSLGGNDVMGLTEQGPTESIWFEGRIQALDFQVDGEDAVVWVASNITRRHQLEQELRERCERDPLTQLYNRRKLLQLLTENLARFQRYQTPTSILVFDLDNLKKLNDSSGHLMGDKAITTLADICQANLRAQDSASRYGGDEFVILMPHTTTEQAQPIAERLRSECSRRLRALGIAAECASISGGLSEFQCGDTDIDAVVSRADGALYQAKAQGRNRIVLAKGPECTESP